MPKGERRRRRQAQEEGEQQNEAMSFPSAAEDVPGEEHAEASEEGRDEASEPSMTSPDFDTDEVPVPRGRRRQGPKRSALAEVLANPAFANAPVEPIDPEPVTAPPSDLFSGTPSQQERPSFAADAGTPAYTPQEEDLSDTQSARQFGSGRAPSYGAPSAMQEPARVREGSPREPVLIALLLVVLVVLLVDTYFVMRLSGRVDRLNAAPSNTTAAPVSADNRPWVGVVTATNQPFANGGQPVTTVRIVNSGHEPAYDLRSNTSGTLAPAATPAPKIPAQKGQLAMTALLLPNVGGTLTFFANTRALTPEEAARVRSGQLVLWLAGRLDYKDSQGHPHLTTFRYRFNPAMNSFVATPEGNSAT
jgi:hypothetical protein